MKLILSPLEIPFMVGDTVWVDQPFGPLNEFPFFQGIITQIILDGSLANSLLIRKREETHELVITTAVYGLKPTGDHEGSPRVNVNVQLAPLRTSLFETKEELLSYQDRINEE